MQITVWTVITYPLDLSGAAWCDDYVAQVSICSMIPLLLKCWVKKADIWVCLLCLLIFSRVALPMMQFSCIHDKPID